jgi:hypothetical protein
MALTVSTGAAPPVRAPAAAPSAQQQAALKQLLSKYAYDQSHGVAASTLANLGKLILSTAQQLGQNVRLPRSSASPAAASAVPVAAPPATTGKINVRA